ncbi:phage protein Gp37 [Brevundimonas sp.]|uniref:phage protein Gp37 n=1 Tax=Brevundimonas sp. TaxID=1871086 RepID=UPI003D6D65D9
MTGIAEIENAILARLQAAGDQSVLGYRFRTLESYPEEFDAYLKNTIKAGHVFPGAWVVFGGWRRPTDAGSSLNAEAVFMVVVAARNLRNEKSQRHGATDKEVGSYQLLLDVSRLLHGQRLGLDIGALQLGPCRSVRPTQTITENQLSVYALEFSAALPIAIGGGLSGPLDDFSTFHANWDAPPFADIEAVPADDQAKATDHLQLETQ